jgi:geranylgeranyl diphosphate synthase type II
VDLITQGKPFTAEQLQYIHASKTAALIETSVHCAALLAETDESGVVQLRAFGRSVGLAFQIVDDILDVEGSAAELGKTLGKDRREEKATYPALYGVEESRVIVSALVDKALEAIEFLGTRGEVLGELARFVSVRRF